MSDVGVVSLIFIPSLVLFVGLMRAPRWFAGSLFRHAIWRLRDEFVDDTIHGRLPAQAAAVQATRKKIEWVLADHTRLTLLQLLAWHRAWKSCPVEWMPKEPAFPVGDLTAEQRSALEAYMRRLSRLSVASVLCGSWPGLLYTTRFLIAAVVRGSDFKPAVTEATMRVKDTDPGRYATAYLGWQVGVANGAPAANGAAVA